ncbi:arginine N-succinyltransferase [Glaciecola sp. XM2]|uniref:arginine N-succinyltransferase n=1 Tax=Glaciecola sp. XM2 TaxID=1914931 RepID=UPI001BDE1E78|nr:arginine N-succinyltransferase [Glaciecola sp. XM2]MBT1449854.1 arginine N-succinyltransferase [Glaciecola sp. XM2]
MLVIRPITDSDYPALLTIAQESGIGFTSLPVNEQLLRKKIVDAKAAFNSTPQKAGSESYLFVMENTETGEVVGTSGIEATVGLHDAFYHYHVGKVVHASRELGVHNTVEILTFCNDYTGVSEICTLFLKENARQGQAGRLLSKFRFLFMAQHRERFSNTVIAEMRGVSDEEGKSPFWEWLERHFFSVDFPTADYLTGIGNKVFIAELMPKYPIYVNLLSKEAQACIGQVHEKTRPALRLLEQEGFRNRGYVDIFDAGPTVEADLSNISTVRNSRAVKVTVDDSPHFEDATQYFVINDKIVDFRACVAPVVVRASGDALVSSETAKALQIESGSKIRVAPCSPTYFS